MSKLPSRFGPYELERRLGAGGMAETFVAVRRGPGGFEHRVCLKRILPAFEEDAEFVRLFLEEARIAATLRHANIVQVVDFGLVDGSHFLALELIDGLDLNALLAASRATQSPITSGIVSYLALELATALDFAHAADSQGKATGVVHRDISPSNVLLSTAGEVKLADFGIAKAVSKTRVTRSGVIKGKVPYMAPEYALTAAFDIRSDLFALGVTLYEAMGGARPYDGATDLDTLRRAQAGEHIPLTERTPGAPTGLVQAIERLICPDPDDRFQTAAAFVDALVDDAPPPTARRILGELVRRHDGDAPRREAHRAAGAPQDESTVAHADTAHATPQGTLVVDPSAPALPRADVLVAAPDAQTRTQGPAGRFIAPSGAASPPGTLLDPRMRPPPSPEPDMVSGDAPTQQAPATKPAAPSSGRPARAMVVGALGSVGLLAFAAIVAWWVIGDGRTPSAVRGAPPRTPAQEAAARPLAGPSVAAAQQAAAGERVAAADAELDAGTSTDAGPTVERPGAEAHPESVAELNRPARLNIVVFPFGEVYVDGRHVGSSPVQVEVTAGLHMVQSEVAGDVRRTPVRVGPGQRRRVVLR